MKSQNAPLQPAVLPGEWETHEACWVAWPSAADLWQQDLPTAQAEFTQLCREIASCERLEVLVPDARARSSAEGALRGLNVRFHSIPFGDIWLRDTAPIFCRTQNGEIVATRFGFNGWGGKYVLPHDDRVSSHVAEASGMPVRSFDWILEGGSVESDGEGTILTSEQCLLNPNRNPSMDRAAIERALADSLGASKVLWVTEGLLNDHTDGHIDTIARYVGPARVVCMRASGSDDPNAEVLARIARELRAMTDARGRKLEVIEIPSPGRVLDEEGEIMPASYVNFYIGNKVVIVPNYGTPYDAQAVAELARVFPDRRVVGVPAKAILTGGGAFHCITQQVPAKGAVK